MKRAVTLIAVIAAMGLVFTGCKKKKAEEKKGGEAMEESMDEMGEAMDDMAEMKEAMDDMAEMKEAMDDMAEMGGDAGGDTLGIKECDEYMKMYKCYLSKLPAAAKGPAEGAYNKMIEAWKKGIDAAMGAAARKDAIAKGCKLALDGWKKAMANNPMAKDCLK